LPIAFDRITGIYDSTRGLAPEIMNTILDSMQEVLSTGSSILDVGVGTGRFACPLNERGYHVVGADVSIPMMRKAKEKGLRDLVRSDAHKLPFQDHAFDYVLMVHLIQLVDDWKNVVSEVARVANSAVISLVGSVSGFRIRQSYLKLREEMDHPLRRLNEAEESLRKLVPPDQTRLVGEYSSTVDCDAAIESLEKGDFAITWDLPRDIHQKIINRLKSHYAGKELARTDTFEIALWKPEQLHGHNQKCPYGQQR
jgi:SAM-dependent methyltransferase